MKCFYHRSDLDGICSGAILQYFYPKCEMIGINYGDKFEWDSIDKDETVYMVDFSLQPYNDMLFLDQICNLVWIDHHKLAIEEVGKVFLDAERHVPKGVREIGKAGCELTWEMVSMKKMPLSVKLFGRYDVWDHSDPRTLPFQYGFRAIQEFPKNYIFWSKVFTDESLIDEIVESGNYIIKYLQKENSIYCKTCSFITTIDGFTALAVNRMLVNSKFFEEVWDNSQYDLMLSFGKRDGKWYVSLYTDRDDIDVSEIAKKYGGGGHAQAAGFNCRDLPFKI